MPDDLPRGVIATDALIGTFARLDEPTLRQNICFLYHLLGGGTGDWDVPIGGMGAVTDALAAAALRYGAEIVTGAEVFAVNPDGDGALSRSATTSAACTESSCWPDVTPAVLSALLGEHRRLLAAPGAQVKVNLMLRRLPRLRGHRRHAGAGVRRHIPHQRDVQPAGVGLRAAARGEVPDPLPCEIYCHSLTDPEHPVAVAAGRLARRH